ncbi:glycoside hydrolase family 2 protein [Saccharicrinis sp. 156]|uniref:glycoside hydrolase family 2 protein n=1 Tax=Saccharicrinis sp. 156 TaxID=3417574 RepID=UPI003D3571AB
MYFKINLFVTTVALSILWSCAGTQQKSIEDYKELIDFNQLSKDAFKSNNAIVDIINKEGSSQISVKSDKQYQAGVTVYSTPDNPWDLKTAHQIKSEVTNKGEYQTQVAMYVGLDPDPLMRWYSSNFVDLRPGETKTITVDLTWLKWVHSPQLDLINMRGVPGREKTARDAIKQVKFSIRYPTQKNHYTINSLYATGTTEVRDTTGFFPFVDQYGQYKHDDWKDKVHSENELMQIAEREIIDLKSHPGNPETNKYGGWEKGEKHEVTGYFYPKKIGGKWWLIDPDGNLFWSAGVNCVQYSSVYTPISKREHYFEGIPEFNVELFHQGKNRETNEPSLAFNHYAYNLQRIYGDNYLDKYRELTHKRFKSWGLNTIGFMSDHGLAEQQKTPYVGSIWIRGNRKIEGSHGYAGKFHDVFDKDFPAIVRASIDRQKFGADDPWCIGYFVDNEMSWGAAGSLSVATLVSPADQPAKQEFVKDLKAKYNMIEKLNKVWGTSHQSWDALVHSAEAPDEELAKEDLDQFYDKISRKYFKTVHDELERVAPHQNYFGCRLAWAQNDITLRAAADYCDIISFNKYEYSVENVGLPDGVDKPIIIGEFHFGSLDRGMFHIGVKGATNQEDRGQKYQEYIQSALRNKYIIGAHWFQYIDEPITGRFDGENYNVGLVNVCNVAYPELTGKIRETCYPMYTYRNDN